MRPSSFPSLLLASLLSLPLAASATVPVTFAPGETLKTIPVLIPGGARPSNQIRVTLAPGANARVGDRDVAFVNVVDGELPLLEVPSTIVLSPSDDVARIPLTVRGPASQSVAFAWATVNGTASAGSDYVATSGSATVETTYTVTVPVLRAETGESAESFSVDLTSVTGAVAERTSVAVTIAAGPPPPPTLSLRDRTLVGETSPPYNSAGVVFVTSSVVALEPIPFHIAFAGGTAEREVDFLVEDADLAIPAGSASTLVQFVVVGDEIVEPVEQFTATISSPVANIGNATSRIQIWDDDTETPGLFLTNVAATEATGRPVMVTFRATLDKPAPSAFTVRYRFEGVTATLHQDFTPAGGAQGDLLFQPGETARELSVAIEGDGEAEGTETFVLRLEPASNVIVRVEEGWATIADDDVPAPQRRRSVRH